jgi:hypothetical protein
MTLLRAPAEIAAILDDRISHRGDFGASFTGFCPEW